MADTFNPEAIKAELTKPLDKMTVKELKALVSSSIPQIVGVSGMRKAELLEEIKKVLGMNEEKPKAKPKAKPAKDISSLSPEDQIKAIKKTIAQLKEQKEQTPKGQRVVREKLRKKIHALKKKTRRLAKA